MLLRHRFNCHLNTITAHAAVAAVAVASVLPPQLCYRLLLPMLPSQRACCYCCAITLPAFAAPRTCHGCSCHLNTITAHAADAVVAAASLLLPLLRHRLLLPMFPPSHAVATVLSQPLLSVPLQSLHIAPAKALSTTAAPAITPPAAAATSSPPSAAHVSANMGMLPLSSSLSSSCCHQKLQHNLFVVPPPSLSNIPSPHTLVNC